MIRLKPRIILGMLEGLLGGHRRTHMLVQYGDYVVLSFLSLLGFITLSMRYMLQFLVRRSGNSYN